VGCGTLTDQVVGTDRIRISIPLVPLLDRVWGYLGNLVIRGAEHCVLPLMRYVYLPRSGEYEGSSGSRAHQMLGAFSEVKASDAPWSRCILF
jgi:hypothetical protein